MRKRRSTPRGSSRLCFEVLEQRQLLTATLRPLPHLDPVFHLPAGPLPLVAADSGTWQEGSAAITTHPLTALPTLHSRPGASAKLFLDFDGAPELNWEGYSVPATPAYDRDGLPTSFSDPELSSIHQIWSRVAESFAPFDVDVTTEDPGNRDDYHTLAVVIGGYGFWTGGTYGGAAFIGSFYNDLPNVVWVFPKNLANGDPKYTAAAAAHEAGHAFGLEHQSLYDEAGNLLAHYNTGDAERAPIMGSAYWSARGLWWFGPDAQGPESYQDELTILTDRRNGWGFRADDHGNSPRDATALTVRGNSVSAAGIIEQMDDVDVFAFETAGGTIALTAHTAAVGAMLDLRLELFTAAGELVASADSYSLGETINATVDAGAFLLVVASHGGYGDIGQYTISGTIVASNPVPAPANLTAELTSATEIRLAWEVDVSRGDEFVVERSTDKGSHWDVLTAIPIGETVYSDVDLVRGRTYWYRVYAVAGSALSDYSNVVSVKLELFEPGPLPSQISGTVFADNTNLDGVQDPGEPGLAGVVITLTGTTTQDESVSQVTTTGTDGSYRFDDLQPGTYTITQTPVPGTIHVGQVTGDPPRAVNSDRSLQVTVTDGAVSSGNNFLEFQRPAGSLSGVARIASDYNKTAIAYDAVNDDNYVWSSGVIAVGGLNKTVPVTVFVVDQFIDFTVPDKARSPYAGKSFHLPVPNAQITYSPTATVASTWFDSERNFWVTTVPSSLGGNTFLSGLAFPVPPGGLPGGLKPVAWSGTFLATSSGLDVKWKWAAAVYEVFSADHSQLGVKPVDHKTASVYQNSDHAGTPQMFKRYVIGGARGGGGSNYTGGYSGTLSVKPCVALLVISGPALASSDPVFATNTVASPSEVPYLPSGGSRALVSGEDVYFGALGEEDGSAVTGGLDDLEAEQLIQRDRFELAQLPI